MARFIVVKHEAKRAGLHFDLRFEIPGSKNWASFAVRKGVPTETGQKVLATRTHDHSTEESLFLGTIETGYGAGKLSKWDSGTCDIEKYTTAHIVINFKGNKLKGIYHMVNIAVAGRKAYRAQGYMIFKGKINK